MPAIRRRRSTDSRTASSPSAKKRRKSLNALAAATHDNTSPHETYKYAVADNESDQVEIYATIHDGHASGSTRKDHLALHDVVKNASSPGQPTHAVDNGEQKPLERPNSVVGPYEAGYMGSDRLQWDSPLGTVYIDMVAERSAFTLRDKERSTCIDLIEATSCNHYKQSTIGWDPVHKKQEMEDETFLFVRLQWFEPYDPPKTLDESHDFYRNIPFEAQEHWALKQHKYLAQRQEDIEPIIGFIGWKVESEGDEYPETEQPVTYIYELHLAPAFRSMGIGKELINLAEQMTRVQCANTPYEPATMLTVFNANSGAKKFYERNGYVKHSSSPEPVRYTRRKVVEPDYSIMIKRLHPASEGETRKYLERRAKLASDLQSPLSPNEKLHPWLS